MLLSFKGANVSGIVKPGDKRFRKLLSVIDKSSEVKDKPFKVSLTEVELFRTAAVVVLAEDEIFSVASENNSAEARAFLDTNKEVHSVADSGVVELVGVTRPWGVLFVVLAMKG